MVKYTPIIAAGLFIWWMQGCSDSPYQQGEALYTYYCANCHMEDGSGLEGLIPPLAQADWLRDNQAILPCIIRKGIEGPIVVNGRTYEQAMAGIPELTETEITNIINYMNQAWGNDYGYIQLTRVIENLQTCP
jgi:mono/diheme cytochrome c family protein